MNETERRHIRSIFRRVHPDLFTKHPQEQHQNSESLKVLNSYVDKLAKRRPPGRARLQFWVKEHEVLRKVEAELPASGSLAPLLLAFGLISKEDVNLGAGEVTYDSDFLDWLRDAVKAVDVHEAINERLVAKCRDVKAKYELSMLLSKGDQFGSVAVSQQQELDALNVVDTAMEEFAASNGAVFAELCIHVYHPDFRTLFYYTAPDGTRTKRVRSGVRDGTVVLVADPQSILNDLRSMDLTEAWLLSRVNSTLCERVDRLRWAVKKALGVEFVRVDCDVDNQEVVRWAAQLLERKGQVQELLGGRQFPFALEIVSDPAEPIAEYNPHRAQLQVRTDCPGDKLLELLTSEGAAAARRAVEDAARAQARAYEEEEELLARVCQALGARNVIRSVGLHEDDKFTQGAEQLLANADKIRAMVDVKSVSIAISDGYNFCPPALIFVPYDFEVSELKPRLLKLLAASTGEAAAAGPAPLDPEAASPNSESPTAASSSTGASNGTPDAAHPVSDPSSSGAPSADSFRSSDSSSTSPFSSVSKVAATALPRTNFYLSGSSGPGTALPRPFSVPTVLRRRFSAAPRGRATAATFWAAPRGRSTIGSLSAAPRGMAMMRVI